LLFCLDPGITHTFSVINQFQHFFTPFLAQYSVVYFSGIFVSPSFKGLLSALYVEVNILWKEIAMEDDSNLDPSGIELKEKLLNFFNKL